MTCKDCKEGFLWDGSSIGKETTVNGAKTYVTGDSKDAAILILTDFFGNELPNIRILADHYAKEYPKVGAIGFCYGGWASFKLAADPSLIDAVSAAHPSGLERSEIDGVKVPVQVLAPEHDHEFSAELKAYTFESLSKTGVPWEYVHFPAMKHGFASRGNPNDKREKDGFERAKRSAVQFFNEFLH
ncbi:dienelactone hydrolase family [Fusarium longipes]|uniref:Dienelactone hydrolase family n=1 Tax=Fusarium longipes TaxID=694270 RepID=A0A395RNE9_9HYPO|nr:dienelactone hydrolase family [Fusarium longipes]